MTRKNQWKAAKNQNNFKKISATNVGVTDALEQTSYRSVIESILYSVVRTRPKPSVAASKLGSFVQKSQKNSMVAAKRRLPYQKRTIS